MEEKKYDKYHIIKFTKETRRSVNPYAVISQVEKVTGERPKAVTGYNSKSLTVEAKSRRQEEDMHKITKVDNFSCETSAHPTCNNFKELIYAYEFDMESLEDFKVHLQERYNIGCTTSKFH